MVSLPDLLARQASEAPFKLALKGPTESWTYAALLKAVAAVAEQIRRRGISRLGLCGDNSVAWVMADLACLMAGVVCVPMPTFFSEEQKAHVVRQAGLEGLLHAGKGDGRDHLGHSVWLAQLPLAAGGMPIPQATAKITFTSGSTGTPKGVCLSGEQLAATTLALKQRLSNTALQHHLCILPLATLLENIAGVYLPLLMGATVEVAPLASLGMSGSSGLNIQVLTTSLNRVRPHSLILVPQVAQALVEAAESGVLDPRDFRFLAVGGGKVAPELLARARDLQMPLFEGYGLSECGSVVALNVPGDERVGSVGRPLSHVNVRVDQQRHIWVKGNTQLGYLGDEPETGGWFDTGDLGSLSADGFLRVDGRAKNLLITSFGRNISPEWLESELVQLIGADQAVVFGDGEPRLSALVVVRDGRSPDVINAEVCKLNLSLPDYARLQAVYIRRQFLTNVDGLVTANGRPIRDTFQAHLPELLANAFVVYLYNVVPKTHGELPMAFFERLQQETAEARTHVTQAPVISAVQQGRFSLEAYNWFLTQAYHHVKHTVPLMMACGGRLPERLEFVREALVEYIEEEYGHHEWILNDLEACGADKEAIRYGTPDTSIELMVSYLYDQINRGNPVAFFGMVQVLEGTSIELATPLGEHIQKHLGLPDQAFSYLYSHGALDQEHFEFFRKLMDDITNPEDQQAIIDSARMVYRLYGDMLHSIPLPASRKDERHEAA